MTFLKEKCVARRHSFPPLALTRDSVRAGAVSTEDLHAEMLGEMTNLLVPKGRVPLLDHSQETHRNLR